MTTSSPKAHYAHVCAAYGCRVNAQLMRNLPDSIESLAALRKLDFSLSTLGHNDIGPVAVAILQNCPNLCSLNVSHNYLTDSSAITLCETLAGHCHSLEHLDLSNNPLSNRTGRYLLRLMDTMPALQHVSVHSTLMNNAMLCDFFQKSQSVHCKNSQQVCSVSLKARTLSPHDTGRFSFGHAIGSPCTKKVALEDGSSMKQWSAINTLWRAAAVNDPAGQDYTGIETLQKFIRSEYL